ncbi:MAG: hypothetical protein ACETWK_06990, partial [Candidatus Aminicenantaceae bacterium]
MELIEYFKSHQGEMINFLEKLVSRESPSSDKEAVNVCSSFLIKEFKKIGTKINHFPQDDIGDLYLIEYPPPTTKV